MKSLHPPLRYGIILAGGKSSRLGLDKAQLRLWGENQATLLDQTAQLLTQFVEEVIISGRSRELFRCIPDNMAEHGPIGGIVSCLQALQPASCLIVSCDLPFLTPSVLETLITHWSQRPKHCLITAFHNASGQLDPLIAIYESAALYHLKKHLQQGQLSLKRCFTASQIHSLPYPSGTETAAFNLNTPDDLAYVQATIRKKNQ